MDINNTPKIVVTPVIKHVTKSNAPKESSNVEFNQLKPHDLSDLFNSKRSEQENYTVLDNRGK